MAHPTFQLSIGLSKLTSFPCILKIIPLHGLVGFRTSAQTLVMLISGTHPLLKSKDLEMVWSTDVSYTVLCDQKCFFSWGYFEFFNHRRAGNFFAGGGGGVNQIFTKQSKRNQGI